MLPTEIPQELIVVPPELAPVAPLAIPEDVSAVSYTHLRAHETVLDLVCRLLLEQKKNAITQACINNKYSPSTQRS